MKRNFRNLILAIAAVLFAVLLPKQSTAQQNNEDPENSKKTISIHVTKQVNGETITIDTTVVTDGEFDADAFLREKGVLNDLPSEMNGKEYSEKAPHFEFHNFDGTFPDTMVFNDRQLRIFGDREHFNFQIPEFPTMPDMPNWTEQMPPSNFHFFSNPNSIDILLQQHGAPFGDMKKMVIKKKRNGKKVTITFENKEEKCCKKGRKSTEDNVYYFNNGNVNPEQEMRVIIQNNNDNSKTVTIETDDNTPKAKKIEKKVVIINK